MRLDVTFILRFWRDLFCCVYQFFVRNFCLSIYFITILQCVKSAKYGVISGPYYTKYLSVFSPNAGKYGPEITPYLDTFHAVISYMLFLLVYENYYALGKGMLITKIN